MMFGVFDDLPEILAAAAVVVFLLGCGAGFVLGHWVF